MNWQEGLDNAWCASGINIKEITKEEYNYLAKVAQGMYPDIPPRRRCQEFRYIDEAFEDSSVVCHEPEPHDDLCFCTDCLS